MFMNIFQLYYRNSALALPKCAKMPQFIPAPCQSVATRPASRILGLNKFVSPNYKGAINYQLYRGNSLSTQNNAQLVQKYICKTTLSTTVNVNAILDKNLHQTTFKGNRHFCSCSSSLFCLTVISGTTSLIKCHLISE